MIGRRRDKASRLDSLRQRQRLPEPAAASDEHLINDMTAPPEPPIALTPEVACSPDTDPEILWHIAWHVPELRRWLVANPQASPELLEYVSQAGGPGVRRALEILLVSIEED